MPQATDSTVSPVKPPTHILINNSLTAAKLYRSCDGALLAYRRGVDVYSASGVRLGEFIDTAKADEKLRMLAGLDYCKEAPCACHWLHRKADVDCIGGSWVDAVDQIRREAGCSKANGFVLEEREGQ